MLALGQINVEQATALLKALGPSQAEELAAGPERRPTPNIPRPPMPPSPPTVPNQNGRAQGRRPRFIKINIATDDPEGKGNVNVVVPYALAKFALRFMPSEARASLDEQGIDIAELLASVENDLVDGQLLNVETDKSDGTGRAHITIEVN